MKERVIVKGEAMWASLFERNEMSDRYQIDICNLDKDAIKALKSINIEVKKGEGEKAEKGHFVTAKTKRLPKVTDSARNPWPHTMVVGNGSTVKCSVSSYEWHYQKKCGIGCSLNSVMIIDYKPYAGEEDLDEEEGFVLEDNTVEIDVIDDLDGDDEL